jgi:uncharacterized RDD family membrane protein YckC
MSHDAAQCPYGPTPYPTPYPTTGEAGPGGYGFPAPQAPPAPLAGWWSRVGAWLIDRVLAVLPYVLGTTVGLLASERVSAPAGDYTEFTPVTWTAFALGAAGPVAVMMWNRYVRQGCTGRSVGKQVLGIRLVSARTAQPVGAWRAFGRDVAHALDAIFYVGYLWPLWDGANQTFADKIVGSVVVRDS